MPTTLDREKVKHKLKKAFKNLDDENIEEIVELLYDDIYKTLSETKVDHPQFNTELISIKSETKTEFETLRGDIKTLAETMKLGFEMNDKRFEEVKNEIKMLADAMKLGFEMVNKRFEEILHYVDKRFEAVDKRFEAVDKRFEELLHYIDKRFEAVDKRFEELNNRFTFLQWFILASLGIFSIVITIITSFIINPKFEQIISLLQELLKKLP